MTKKQPIFKKINEKIPKKTEKQAKTFKKLNISKVLKKEPKIEQKHPIFTKITTKEKIVCSLTTKIESKAKLLSEMNLVEYFADHSPKFCKVCTNYMSRLSPDFFKQVNEKCFKCNEKAWRLLQNVK